MAGRTAQSTADTLSEGAAEAKQRVASAVEDARAAASEAADTISAQAKEAVEIAKSAADEGASYVRARYQENPGMVIAVGAAALVGAALLLRGIFRR